jgi:hypothetical protein
MDVQIIEIVDFNLPASNCTAVRLLSKFLNFFFTGLQGLSTRQHEDMAMAFRPLPMSALAYGIHRPSQWLLDPLIIGTSPCFLF